MMLSWVIGWCSQDGGAAPLPGITVNASGSVKIAPTALQVSFAIEGKGEGITKAIETLDGRRKEAVEKLKKLGVEEKNIQAEPPGLKRMSANEAQAMMRGNAPHRLKKKKEVPDAAAAKEPVTVQQTVTARFPLSAKDGAGILVEVEGIKDRVKGAQILPKEAKEEGEGDEDSSMQRYRMMQELQQSGVEDGFRFLFFGRADGKAEDEAALKAMTEARRAAETAARAMGKTAGPPVSVEIHGSGGGSAQEQMAYYYRRGMYYGGEYPTAASSVSEPGDLVGMTADSLVVMFTVKVVYSLAK